jgi:hypothetical protein
MVIAFLMIVDNLNFVGAALGPHETDAPLLVDSDAMLAFSATSKRLQPIPWDGLQVREARGVANHLKFSHRCPLEALET